MLPGLLDGGLQPADGKRIFRADVNVTLIGADGVTGDGHALDDGVRVAFENAAVHERAGSPSSPLQTTYLWSAFAFVTVDHFSPVGNPAPPRPRRPLWVMVSTTCARVRSWMTWWREE